MKKREFDRWTHAASFESIPIDHPLKKALTKSTKLRKKKKQK